MEPEEGQIYRTINSKTYWLVEEIELDSNYQYCVWLRSLNLNREQKCIYKKDFSDEFNFRLLPGLMHDNLIVLYGGKRS